MPCTLYNSAFQVLNDTKLINNLIWIDLEVAFHMRILDLNNNGYWPIVHSIHCCIEQYETFQNVHFRDAHIYLFFDRCKFLFKQIRNRFYWNIPSNPYTDRHKYTHTRGGISLCQHDSNAENSSNSCCYWNRNIFNACMTQIAINPSNVRRLCWIQASMGNNVSRIHKIYLKSAIHA